jgi:PAS domain S-box-containing protein
MRVRPVVPQNVASEFQLEEMFFSTTDPKGVITSGNSVFVRVSGFSAAELIGQPHNLIRHPDMPRAVFRLAWRTLAAGQPIVAFVKNMAKDGRFYWVVAFLTPIEGGYLSIRFKPSSPLLGTVEQLYARMRAAERELGDAGEKGREGMDAAEKLLRETLRELGFGSYETFMWHLMHVEMKSREEKLRHQRGVVALDAARTPAQERLVAIHEAGVRACSQIDRLYRRLDELAGFGTKLLEKSAFVTDLTRDIRFVALSTSIKAARLGDIGNSLGIIASFLSDSSARTAADVARLTTRIRDITAEMQGVAFRLSGARLEIEMVLIFCRELLAEAEKRAEAGPSRARMIGDLERAFTATSARAAELLNSLAKHLHELNFEAEDLRKTMLMLQVAQVCGMVETNRIRADLSVAAIFEEVREQVAKSSVELGELGDITARFSRLIREAPEIEREVGVAIDRIRDEVDGLDEIADEAPKDEPRSGPASVRRLPDLALAR